VGIHLCSLAHCPPTLEGGQIIFAGTGAQTDLSGVRGDYTPFNLTTPTAHFLVCRRTFSYVNELLRGDQNVHL
jgi:hypothetical protein